MRFFKYIAARLYRIYVLCRIAPLFIRFFRTHPDLILHTSDRDQRLVNVLSAMLCSEEFRTQFNRRIFVVTKYQLRKICIKCKIRYRARMRTIGRYGDRIPSMRDMLCLID